VAHLPLELLVSWGFQRKIAKKMPHICSEAFSNVLEKNKHKSNYVRDNEIYNIFDQ